MSSSGQRNTGQTSQAAEFDGHTGGEGEGAAMEAGGRIGQKNNNKKKRERETDKKPKKIGRNDGKSEGRFLQQEVQQSAARLARGRRTVVLELVNQGAEIWRSSLGAGIELWRVQSESPPYLVGRSSFDAKWRWPSQEQSGRDYECACKIGRCGEGEWSDLI